MVIWKQKIALHSLQKFALPKGARILSVGSAYEYDDGALKDRECIFFWFLCDPDAPKVERIIQVCRTGHSPAPPADDSKAKFIGTLQLDDGFVVHIFERFGT